MQSNCKMTDNCKCGGTHAPEVDMEKGVFFSVRIQDIKPVELNIPVLKPRRPFYRELEGKRY